jgi:hypothetical protein
MSTFSKLTPLQPYVFSLMLVLPSFAFADSGLNYGSGPDGYRSYSLKVNSDLSKTLQLNLDYFLAKSTGVDDTREIGAGLTWYATELASANYRYSVINDGRVEVKGNEGGLSLALDTLWQGELRTTLDLGYGAFKYKAANPQSIAASNLALTQNRSSLGISQDISSFLTIYGSHDQYKYDKNLTLQNLLASELPIIRLRLAATLLSYPDKTNMLGITWRITDNLSLDLSSAKTTTLLEQEQKNTRVGFDFQINNKLSVAAAVTRVRASAIYGPLGGTLQPATQSTYTEFSVGWGF